MSVDKIIPPAPASGQSFRTFRHGGLIIGTSLAVAVSAGLVLAQQPQQPTAPPAAVPLEVARPAAPVNFDVVSVQRGDIQQTVDATGKLQFYKYADANVQVAGQIREVLFSVGDHVQAGDVVIEITPTTTPVQIEKNRAQMARLQAELADQRAQMDFAELQFKRQTQLKAQNATREDAFESSRMNLSSASARVDSINAQIRQVEATLKMEEDSRQHTQVLAPISGTIVALNARAGQTASEAPPAAPLVRIADLSKMTVQARVAEIDVTRLRRGMTANFKTPGYPDRVWSGKLRQVLPVPADGSGEQGKQTFYNVLFEVDNPGQELMSGMSTQVQFIVAQAKDAVVLPINLLGRPDAHGQYNVNVVGADGQPSARKLKIGLRNQQQVQVLSGLEAGERLIVGPGPEPATRPKQKQLAPIAGNRANSAIPAATTKPAGPASPAKDTPAVDMLISVGPTPTR